MSYHFRPMREADLEIVFDWRNSARIRKVSYHDHVISWEEHLRWFKSLENNEEKMAFIFEDDGRPLGTVNFADIDHKNRRCRWGFYLGEADLKKGVGTRMGIMAIDYVFDELGLEKLCAETFDFNEVSIAYHLKMGFLREGILKRHQFKEGKLLDLIVFGLLREDWIKRRRELIER